MSPVPALERMIMRGRIFLWDIETGLNIVSLFSLFQNQKVIHYDAIEQERYVICASVKELGMKGIKTFKITDSDSFRFDPTDDRKMLADLFEYLSEADALIAHNGDNFDLKYVNTRALKHGLKPLPNIITIDTLKIAKNHFKFNSNRLDYIAKFLGLGGKEKCPQSNWVDAMYGSNSAVDKIAHYNRRDVEVLEEVYIKLAPYTESKLNQALFADDEEDIVCPLCGSEHFQSRGSRYTRVTEYQRYQCTDCGHWFTGTHQIRRVGVKSK